MEAWEAYVFVLQMVAAASLMADLNLPPFSIAGRLLASETHANLRLRKPRAEKLAKIALYVDAVEEYAKNAGANEQSDLRALAVQRKVLNSELSGALAESFRNEIGPEAHEDSRNLLGIQFPISGMFDDRHFDALNLDRAQKAAIAKALGESALANGANWRSRAERTTEALSGVLQLRQKKLLEERLGLVAFRPNFARSPLMGKPAAKEKLPAVPFVRGQLNLTAEMEKALSDATSAWLASVAKEFQRFESDESVFDVPRLDRRMADADARFVDSCDRILGDVQKRRLSQFHFQMVVMQDAFTNTPLAKELRISLEQKQSVSASVERRSKLEGDDSFPKKMKIYDEEKLRVLTPEQRRMIEERSGVPESPAKLMVARLECLRLDRPAAWNQPGWVYKNAQGK